MKSPEPIYPIRAEHGEGPVWDVEEQLLYWVDILEGRYFKADYEGNYTRHFAVGQPLGVLALRREGGLVMGLRDGFGLWNEQGRELQLLSDSPVAGNPEVRFNDGAVDPAGRFFAGTMEWKGSKPIGQLFRLDTDFSVTLLEENLYISNGMGWSPDRQTFYFIDTGRHVVYAYDYDLLTGDIANRRPFIRFANDENPDGMTIDAEGGFWIALYGGGKIARFDSTGRRIGDIELPVPKPTSCCFGGPDLTTLFITTTQENMDERQRQEYPLSGRMFYLETDTRGVEQRRFGN